LVLLQKILTSPLLLENPKLSTQRNKVRPLFKKYILLCTLVWYF
jgi:hypothetical protein